MPRRAKGSLPSSTRRGRRSTRRRALATRASRSGSFSSSRRSPWLVVGRVSRDDARRRPMPQPEAITPICGGRATVSTGRISGSSQKTTTCAGSPGSMVGSDTWEALRHGPPSRSSGPCGANDETRPAWERGVGHASDSEASDRLGRPPQAARLDRHRGAAPRLARGRHGLGGRRPARDVHQVDHDAGRRWPASSAARSATASSPARSSTTSPARRRRSSPRSTTSSGSRHDFTARMHVEQTGLHAVLVGVVTDGWGNGKLVTGAYDQVTCEHGGLTTDLLHGLPGLRQDPPAAEPQERRAAGRTALPALGASLGD